MNTPTISIINFSNGLSDKKVQEAIRVINRQVLEDFIPIWVVRDIVNCMLISMAQRMKAHCQMIR
jgi:hypothetical protein